MTGLVAVVIAVGVPALVFALWPLASRQRRGRTLLPLPPDPREQLLEDKRAALRALRELEFEHDSGHVGDEDYADLRARYEAEAATILTALDGLGTRPEQPAPAPPPREGARRSAWLHPAALAAGAVLLVAFGVALGTGLVRHTTPEPTDATPAMGALPPMGPEPEPAPGGAPGGRGGAGARPVTPEILKGMLQAARASLFEGRYTEAIAAYQAVLKRDPKNVDATTHLGLIVAIGGHADTALETFDRALAIDPRYPPALLYRGQVLYEAKRDVAGAIRSWEKFLSVAPDGEERERVVRMIADAKAKGKSPAK